MKRTYQSHMFNSRREFIFDFEKEGSTKDRFYMAEMIKPTIAILDNYGVTNYQNFNYLFKKAGFKAKEIILIINEFIKYINSNEQTSKINWIKKRELIKSNFGEKNIIFNRLALEYPNELVNFIYFYLIRKFPFSDNNVFISEMKVLIDEIEKQKNLDRFLKLVKNNGNNYQSQTATIELIDKNFFSYFYFFFFNLFFVYISSNTFCNSNIAYNVSFYGT